MREIFIGNSIKNQFIQVIPITLLVGLLYIIFRFLKLKKNNSDIVILIIKRRFCI